MDTSHAQPRGRVRWPFTQLFCLLALSAVAHEARAHPAPFSYLDLHLDVERTGGTLVIHDFDAAYELGIEDPQALLEPGVARERADELLAIVAERLRIAADGDYAEFNRLFLEHARTARAAGKTPEQAAADLQLPAKFSGYNLTGRGGPVTNLTVIYDELAR
jgi:hypothetical protein